MDSWKTTQFEMFTSKNFDVMCKFYKVDKFFVTYKRWNIWYEMKFEHNLN
jgi:hypothetical protein